MTSRLDDCTALSIDGHHRQLASHGVGHENRGLSIATRRRSQVRTRRMGHKHPAGGQRFESAWVDLSSHSANPPGVFDGEPVPLPALADSKIEEGIEAVRRFVTDQRCFPTEETWTAARMVPSERTIRRRFGSFRAAVALAGTSPKASPSANGDKARPIGS